MGNCRIQKERVCVCRIIKFPQKGFDLYSLYKTTQMLDYWLKYTDLVQSGQAKLSPENRFSCLFVPTCRHGGFRKKHLRAYFLGEPLPLNSRPTDAPSSERNLELIN